MSSHVILGISTDTSLMPLGSTSLKARRKSSMSTLIFSKSSVGTGFSRSNRSMWRARHFIAASLHSAARSAPTNPWVIRAMASMSTSSSRGMVRVWTSRIDFLPSLLGMPISISLSKRPGLLSAGSIESSWLVAPITITFPRPPIPSMRVRSCATTRLSTSPSMLLRFGAMESISSMNIMLGLLFSACAKTLRSLSSDSP